MALLNHAKKELNAKIVYYGPGLSGKTTNLEWIHKKMEPEKRGKLISLETKTDRTLFFDFLPVQIGEIAGYRMRFNVYTVPGQIFYNETRKMVLKGVDGVVFVADCQKEMASENVESLKNLSENLASIDKRASEIPMVLQYNKMDLPNTLTVEEMNRLLNAHGHPFFEAIAVQGEGVLTTLARITRMVAEHLRTHLFEEKQKAPAVPLHAVRAQQSEPSTRRSVPASVGREAPAGTASAVRAPERVPGPRVVGEPARACDAEPVRAVTTLPPATEGPLLSDPDENDLSEGASLGPAPMRRESSMPLRSSRTPDIPGLEVSHRESCKARTLGNEHVAGEHGALAAAGPHTDADPGREPLGHGKEPSPWVDPSVVRFPEPAVSSPVPRESFSVRMEGPQGQQGMEIHLPVRIRRESTGEEICFRLRIQMDPCEPKD